MPFGKIVALPKVNFSPHTSTTVSTSILSHDVGAATAPVVHAASNDAAVAEAAAQAAANAAKAAAAAALQAAEAEGAKATAAAQTSVVAAEARTAPDVQQATAAVAGVHRAFQHARESVKEAAKSTVNAVAQACESDVTQSIADYATSLVESLVPGVAEAKIAAYAAAITHAAQKLHLFYQAATAVQSGLNGNTQAYLGGRTVMADAASVQTNLKSAFDLFVHGDTAEVMQTADVMRPVYNAAGSVADAFYDVIQEAHTALDRAEHAAAVAASYKSTLSAYINNAILQTAQQTVTDALQAMVERAALAAAGLA